MIIREELKYKNTFIRGDILDFEKGYSKHGTFLKINNKIIDCGYIEKNSIVGTTFEFVTMGECLSIENIIYQLKDLLKCKPRMYYLMTPEQKIELNEAIKRRYEGKFEEALRLHIDYCDNYMGRVEGEVFEELYKLLTSMGYYDLALCFMALSNLSEVQTYIDDETLSCRGDRFDNFKEIVEYQNSEEENCDEVDRLKVIINEITGTKVNYKGKLIEIYNFLTENMELIVNGEYTNIKYNLDDDYIYLNKSLILELLEEGAEVQVDGRKIEDKGKGVYSDLWSKVAKAKTQ